MKTNNITGMLVALVVVVMIGVTAFLATAVPRLSEQALALEKGEKAVITVEHNRKDEPKWTSSNSKVVSVAKDGTVKGLKKGQAIVTAEVGSEKLTCIVQVA